MKFCPKNLPFLELTLEGFLSLMAPYEILPNLFAFFEPKFEHLKLFEVGCPDLSWVSVLDISCVTCLGLNDGAKPRIFYKLFS